MTNTMRYLSRILTIVLLFVAMPSSAQTFTFKNMCYRSNDGTNTLFGDIIVMSNNGSMTVIRITNGKKEELIIGPYKYNDNCFSIDMVGSDYSAGIAIGDQFIIYEVQMGDKEGGIMLVSKDRDAYTREFNRMKQVLLGGSSVQNSTNITASVEKVWVDHDVFENGVKGMRIHVKFNINGMLNKTGRASAYFYLDNGNALKDYNDRFCTVDGCVAAGRDFTPNYERCTFHDLTIFMPHSELELSQPAKCYFFVEIHDNNNQNRASSEKVYFNYNR